MIMPDSSDDYITKKNLNDFILKDDLGKGSDFNIKGSDLNSQIINKTVYHIYHEQVGKNFSEQINQSTKNQTLASNDYKPEILLPLQPRFESLKTDFVWAQAKNQPDAENVSTNQKTTQGKYIDEIIDSLKNGGGIPAYVTSLPPSQFKESLFSKIFMEIAKHENHELIKKCWNAIPFESGLILKFIAILKEHGIKDLGGEHSNILQTLGELNRSDAMGHLIHNHILKGVSKATVIELFLSRDMQVDNISASLESIYGMGWIDNKEIAIALGKNYPIAILSRLYGATWKKNKEIALVFLEKNANCAKMLDPTVSNSKSFWLEASKLGNFGSFAAFIPKTIRENSNFWTKVIVGNSELISYVPQEFNTFAFWSNPDLWKDSKLNASELMAKLPNQIKDNPEFLKTIAAQKIQKKFRSSQISKKIHATTSQEIEVQKDKPYSIAINKRVRQPLENIERHSKWAEGDSPLAQSRQAITKATKLGTYEKFDLALKATFAETLKSIYSSPPTQRKYVIIADDLGKSSNWVVAHLHDLMSAHPPVEIVSRNNLTEFLKNNPDVHHVVMVDDGTYSGEQASRYVDEIVGLNESHKFHVAIPYMTNFGKNRISASLQRKECEYEMHNSQTMRSYEELDKIDNIFSYTGRVIVDSEKISQLALIPNEENQNVTNEVNHKILMLKEISSKTLDAGSEEIIYKNILETMFFIDDHLDVLGETGQKIMQNLLKSMKAEQSDSKHHELIFAYTSDARISQLPPSKTPSWFSHKGADDVSTNYEEMFNVSGQHIPVEPYKETNDVIARRSSQIEDLHVAMGESTLEKTIFISPEHSWLKGRVDFVHSNRGFFLLGNSYIRETKTPPILLHFNDQTIELGGQAGEYQYKIKKGDIFELECPITHSKAKLKLDNSGKLIPFE